MQEVEVGVLHNDSGNTLSLPRAFDVEGKEIVSVVQVIKSTYQTANYCLFSVLNYSHCDSQTNIFLGGLIVASTNSSKGSFEAFEPEKLFLKIKINKSESKPFILDWFSQVLRTPVIKSAANVNSAQVQDKHKAHLEYAIKIDSLKVRLNSSL